MQRNARLVLPEKVDFLVERLKERRIGHADNEWILFLQCSNGDVREIEEIFSKEHGASESDEFYPYEALVRLRIRGLELSMDTYYGYTQKEWKSFIEELPTLPWFGGDNGRWLFFFALDHVHRAKYPTENRLIDDSDWTAVTASPYFPVRTMRKSVSETFEEFSRSTIIDPSTRASLFVSGILIEERKMPLPTLLAGSSGTLWDCAKDVTISLAGIAKKIIWDLYNGLYTGERTQSWQKYRISFYETVYIPIAVAASEKALQRKGSNLMGYRIVDTINRQKPQNDADWNAFDRGIEPALQNILRDVIVTPYARVDQDISFKKLEFPTGSISNLFAADGTLNSNRYGGTTYRGSEQVPLPEKARDYRQLFERLLFTAKTTDQFWSAVKIVERKELLSGSVSLPVPSESQLADPLTRVLIVILSDGWMTLATFESNSCIFRSERLYKEASGDSITERTHISNLFSSFPVSKRKDLTSKEILPAFKKIIDLLPPYVIATWIFDMLLHGATHQFFDTDVVHGVFPMIDDFILYKYTQDVRALVL